MARWIALDLGKARTGIAVTDAHAIVASPLETVVTSELMDRLKELVAAEPCAGFVVGDPGPAADSAELVQDWMNKLQKAFHGLAMHPVDEYNTSREARAAMVAGGMRKKKRQEKGAMDRIAAALILQRFLDAGSTPPPLPLALRGR